MLDIDKLKKRDFQELLRIVQTKMKLGLITDEVYNQSSWCALPTGRGYWSRVSSHEQQKIPANVHTCGCTACIGGWMALEAGVRNGQELYKFTSAAGAKADMNSLFAGEPFNNGRHPSVRQARRAIQNYFDGSKEPWQRVGRA